MSDKKKKSKQISDVTPPPGLFQTRVTEKLHVINGYTFTIRGISDTIGSYCGDAAYDDQGKYNATKHVFMVLRFGLIDIRPPAGEKLLDDQGEPVKIARDTIKPLGKTYRCIRFEILEGLPKAIAQELFHEIIEISNLKSIEKDAQDFTTDSDNT